MAALTASTAVLLVLVAIVTAIGYARTAQERQKAEDTSALAIAALDNIFRQFAPERTAPASGLLVVGETDEGITVPAQAVLSKEAAAMLENLLAFYDRLADQGGDDARLRRKVAEANRRVGDIRQRLGQYEESKAAYLHAIELYERLAETSGEVAELRTEIARIHNELGNLHLAMNEWQDVRPSYTSALETLQGVAEASSNLPQYQYELAPHVLLSRKAAVRGIRGCFPLAPGGHRFSRFDRPRVRVEGDSAPRVLPTLRTTTALDSARLPVRLGRPTTRPAKVRRHPELKSRGRNRGPGGLPPHLADPEEREKNLHKAIEILERLIAEHPDAPDYRQLLARCYREIRPAWGEAGSKPAPDGQAEVGRDPRTTCQRTSRRSRLPPRPYPDLRFADPGVAVLVAGVRRRRAEAVPRNAREGHDALRGTRGRTSQHSRIRSLASTRPAATGRSVLEQRSGPGRERIAQGDRRTIDADPPVSRRTPTTRWALAVIQESMAVLLRDRGQLPESEAAHGGTRRIAQGGPSERPEQRISPRRAGPNLSEPFRRAASA